MSRIGMRGVWSGSVVVLLVLTSLVRAAEDPTKTKSFRWDLGSAADVDAQAAAHFTTTDRVGDVGTDGDVTFRALKPDVYQAGWVVPAFDIDPQAFNSINHSFYLTIRFKDLAKAPIFLYAGKGGDGFYGAIEVGLLGGAGDGQWKEQTIIIPRSMMRSEDGKSFRFAINNVKAAVPVDWMLLFSADASGLPDKEQRIAAAHEADQKRIEALLEKTRKNKAGDGKVFTDFGYPDPGPNPQLSDEEKSSGLRVFFPPIQRTIYPNSQPQKDEMPQTLAIYGTPGQAQTLVVAVRATKEVGNVSVSLSDATGPAPLPLAKSTVRWGIYRPQRIGSSWGSDYRVIVDQLSELPNVPVKPDRLEQAFITVRLPADAKPGDYSGKITVASEQGGKREIPFKLTVYPFALEHPEHATHGLFYYIDYGRVSPLELQDMLDHGMDTMVGGLHPQLLTDAQGVPLNTDTVRQGYKYLKDMGFRSPLICTVGAENLLASETPENRSKYQKLVADGKKLAEEAGFKNTSFFPIDEPHDPAKIALAQRACQWIAGVPGARSFVTSNPNAVKVFGSVLNDVCYNLTYLKPENLALMAKGSTLMYYCPSFSAYAGDVRYRSGFYFARSKAQTVYFFAYFLIEGDVYVDFDGGNRDWNVVWPSMTSIYHDPSVSWEAMREGVNDYRYVYTLQALADRADKAGKKEAATKARKILDEVMSAVDPDGQKAGGPTMGIEANTARAGEKVDPSQLKAQQEQVGAAWYEQSRQKIAAAIVELGNAGVK